MTPPGDSRPHGDRGRTPPIAVTMGDPAGIGLDVTLLSWLARESRALPPFLVFGDVDALRLRARQLGIAVPLAVLGAAHEAAAAFPTALPIKPVVPAAAGGSAAPGEGGIVLAAIEQATAAVAAGEALALLTNPATKRALHGPHLAYPGHTELLAVLAAHHFGGRRFRPVMMLAADELKVVPATVHIPLAAVPARLSQGLLIETLRITAAALHEDFGLSAPRLAVCGLNPHAGEDGLIGREEGDVIQPAIAALQAEGAHIAGPLPADTMFSPEARRGYDAAIAMYHDQALIPIKTLAFDRAVNITLGLPFVRTSPDHGTAFERAGTGEANPGSFIAALRLAHQLGLRRAARGAPARP